MSFDSWMSHLQAVLDQSAKGERTAAITPSTNAIALSLLSIWSVQNIVRADSSSFTTTQAEGRPAETHSVNRAARSRWKKVARVRKANRCRKDENPR